MASKTEQQRKSLEGVVKPKPPQSGPKGPLQRRLDNEQIEKDQSFIDVLTPQQRASGEYASGFEENGNTQQTKCVGRTQITIGISLE